MNSLLPKHEAIFSRSKHSRMSEKEINQGVDPDKVQTSTWLWCRKVIFRKLIINDHLQLQINSGSIKKKNETYFVHNISRDWKHHTEDDYMK